MDSISNAWNIIVRWLGAVVKCYRLGSLRKKWCYHDVFEGVVAKPSRYNVQLLHITFFLHETRRQPLVFFFRAIPHVLDFKQNFHHINVTVMGANHFYWIRHIINMSTCRLPQPSIPNLSLMFSCNKTDKSPLIIFCNISDRYEKCREWRSEIEGNTQWTGGKCIRA